MSFDLIVFPSHDWRRRLADGGSLRHAALCDAMIQDRDIARLLWVRRVHPRRLLAGPVRTRAFTRRPLLPVAGGVLYRITTYRGLPCRGRYILEHQLPHALNNLLAAQLVGILALSGWKRPVLWVGDPKEAWAFHALSASRRVFDGMDDWTLAPEFQSQRARIEAGYRLAARAEVITCNTNAAARNLAGHPRVLSLPNAAGDDLLPVHERDARRRPRLGLVGHYSRERLDLDLLRLTLTARPDCDIVHIGTWIDPNRSLTRDVASLNMRSLGRLDNDATHEEMRGLDLLLSPHPVSPYTLSQDRLTVYDALAMGLPVLTTPVPPADRLASWCYVARTPEEWVTGLDRALGEDPAQRRARREALACETWSARWRVLKEVLCD